MPPFRDDQIIIIAPGAQTTLAQLGLPESFTPARLRVKSRMFPAENKGEWEPYKVRRKGRQPLSQDEIDETNEVEKSLGESEEDVTYEEDSLSEEGAVWPMPEGRVTNWPCFFALLTHVYNALNPPFHTPILLISEPAWTPKDHERVTQFIFEKFKTPAFSLMDSAMATCYAYGLPTATIVDVGWNKADVTAIVDFIARDVGRTIALPNCGGGAMTERLLELLGPKGFTKDMCEQLKQSPICEVLPLGTPLPGTTELEQHPAINPAAAASTGANGAGPGARTAAMLGEVPRGPGPDTEVGIESKDEEENEGVLDVATIVASGKMNEYLAEKEKEKAERVAAKKKGAEAAAALARAVRLPNSRRERNTFLYEDHVLLNCLKGMDRNGKSMAEVQATPDEGSSKRQKTPEPVAEAQPSERDGEPKSAVETNESSTLPSTMSGTQSGPMRREVEVGLERFQAASGGLLDRIADAVYRTISSVEDVPRRSELWDSLVIVGNGSKVRGFKEALLTTLNSKYLISPSSATIFTSELPSNLSTPAGTGANTPQPQLGPHGGGSGHVNPLLLAATTAQNPYLNPGNVLPYTSQSAHSSHGQTPTSIKTAKVPEYFPEWKEVGYDEAMFLGAQVAAKVLFVVDQGLSKGFMTRTDYNNEGPVGISEYSL